MKETKSIESKPFNENHHSSRVKNGKKMCNSCRETKLVGDFYKRNNPKKPGSEKIYFRANCKKCLKKMNRVYWDAYVIRYPGKNRARVIFRRAVMKGVIIPKPCKICKSIKNIHGHHVDYRKPLEIVWLCRDHHEDVHHKK